ncbi:hypothetical protein, partial [Bacteroides heparinolyticus]|uniref:hypothetical protein n=1 Tax=Prevotella heparinolytica TaxID=28113 RepID=UPI00359FF5AF
MILKHKPPAEVIDLLLIPNSSMFYHQKKCPAYFYTGHLPFGSHLILFEDIHKGGGCEELGEFQV